MVEPHRLHDIGRIFVGRRRELGALTAALDDAISGHGRLVMLAGEPGIGKSRTAQELGVLAEQQGAQVFWGRCYEEEGTPPYWPWVQAIRSYVQQTGSEKLIAETGRGATAISTIVPDILAKITDLDPSPSMEDPNASRFRLFDSFATFLKNASRSKPMMLVLDDLHSADQASLSLLEFLARELGESSLLLVGCYRDTEVNRQHVLTETLARLSREPVFQRQVLRGLTQDDLGDLIVATTGAQIPQALTDAIYARTEGNPFFTTEVINLLSESGELADGQPGSSRELKIPEGVREVIGQRLNRLSKQGNEVLTTASIIGREFDFQLLLGLVSEVTEDRLLQVVEEASSFHLIEDVPGRTNRYQFRHALIQQTLAEDVTTSRKVRLHARIAEGLEALYGADAEAHAAELAHHFAEAESVLGPDKLVRYSLLAGETSLASYAWEQAQNHFARGLTARNLSLTDAGRLPDAEAAELTFGLVRARIGTAARVQMQEPVELLSRVFDFYVENSDTRNAIAVAEHHVPIVGDTSGMAQIIRKALSFAAPSSLAEGRLLARYGLELGRVEGDLAGAQEAFNRALAIAREAGDAGLELITLTRSAEVDSFQLRLEESLAKGLECIELAVRAGNVHEEVSARLTAVRALIQLGDSAAAETQASDLLTAGERFGDRYWTVATLLQNSNLAYLKGDWSKSRSLGQKATELAPQDAEPVLRLASLEYETGNFIQGEAHVNRLLGMPVQTIPGPRSSHLWPTLAISQAALISGSQSWLDKAAETARSFLSSPTVTPTFAIAARCSLGLKAVIQGDAQAAAEQYRALEAVQNIRLPVFMIIADRMLGLLAHTMGEFDQAANHFDGSLSFCRRAGYLPEMAWTCFSYAETLLQRNNPGDREHAISMLEESVSISTELGMRPLMERAQEQINAIGLAVAPKETYPNGLTEREVQVIRLVAKGNSNREIAEELIISLRTVANHVANILNKTNSANRAEAASFATREDLL